MFTVTRHSSLVFANEPWSTWRLLMTTSPGAQTIGTGVRQPLGPPLRHHRLDVHLAEAVGAGHHPHPVRRRAAVELGHEVEPVRALVPVGALPVGNSVLVPGDRGAPPRLLDEEGVRERHEVLAVDRGRNREEFRVAVEAHARVRELERPEDEIERVVLQTLRERQRVWFELRPGRNGKLAVEDPSVAN